MEFKRFLVATDYQYYPVACFESIEVIVDFKEEFKLRHGNYCDYFEIYDKLTDKTYDVEAICINNNGTYFIDEDKFNEAKGSKHISLHDKAI